MKKTAFLIALTLSIASLFTASAYALGLPPDNPALNNPDCSPLAGWYLGLNGGYTYFQTVLRRPLPPQGTNQPHPNFPLTNPYWNESSYDINPVIGYDFYPVYQLPFRIEVSGNYYGKESRTEDQLLLFLPVNQSQTQTDQQVGYNSYQVEDILGNVYFDWHNSTPFTPFIGAGIGVDSISTSFKSVFLGNSLATAKANLSAKKASEATHDHFIWDVVTGVSYAATTHISLLAEANYTDLGNINFPGTSHSKTFYSGNTLRALSGLVGIRYTF